MADGGAGVGTLAVCGGRMVWVGGDKGGVCSKKVMELRGRWSYMSDMLVRCWGSCVLSVSGGGMVVILSHVAACQQWSMGTWSSRWEVQAWTEQCGVPTFVTW